MNWRVTDLDALLSRLSAAGIAIERQEDYPYGRFCWFRDPEGNPLEAWQPAS